MTAVTGLPDRQAAAAVPAGGEPYQAIAVRKYQDVSMTLPLATDAAPVPAGAVRASPASPARPVQTAGSRSSGTLSPQLAVPPVPAVPMALFLDVDGTLLDIAARPDSVQVPALLPGHLACARHGALALLSGRALATLDGMFAPHRFAAAGLHGLERRDASGRLAVDAAPAPAMAALRAGLERIHAAHPGLLLEDKGGSLALHWRQSPALAPAALAAARALAQRLGHGFQIQHGKQMVEIRPSGPDKGQALHSLMATAPFKGRVPMVFGDDLTDESAFQAAGELGGWSVIVGPRRPTRADCALPGPAAMRDWLAALPQQLAGPRP